MSGLEIWSPEFWFISSQFAAWHWTCLIYFKGNFKENAPFQRNGKGVDFEGFPREGKNKPVQWDLHSDQWWEYCIMFIRQTAWGNRERGRGSKNGATGSLARQCKACMRIFPEVAKWLFYSDSVCSIMIQRHSKKNDEQGERKKKVVSVPTNYQVLTLSARLVVLIFSFKNRTLWVAVFGFLEMFLTLQTFNQSQDFLVAKQQCCLCTIVILVLVKVKDSCCATVSCAQTLLVPSSYKQDINMPMVAQSTTINTAPQALCVVWFSVGILIIWTVQMWIPPTLLGVEVCIIEK